MRHCPHCQKSIPTIQSGIMDVLPENERDAIPLRQLAQMFYGNGTRASRANMHHRLRDVGPDMRIAGWVIKRKKSQHTVRGGRELLLWKERAALPKWVTNKAILEKRT